MEKIFGGILMKKYLLILSCLLIIIGCNDNSNTKEKIITNNISKSDTRGKDILNSNDSNQNHKQSLTITNNDYTFPKWLKGTWSNRDESIFRFFESWIFRNDSIFISNYDSVMHNSVYCLNTIYHGYKITRKFNDSIYRINFIKDNEIIIYRFHLNKENHGDGEELILTLNMTINGIVNDIKFLHSRRPYIKNKE